ncbi:hypothetical protein Taro_042715 [Colocasia esculenta]|uniref:Retrotransposon gag domain-containing protein n=1 Tax=Colocasia esculenta TaxID=4460 RepID=A0A843WQA5_COLES|nr:hypothetical protein [Colocasia esculenta]
MVGVVFLLVRVSRGEMSLGVRIRVSNRPQHPRVLPIPRLHSRLNWRLSRLRSEPTCGGPRCYVLSFRMMLWGLGSVTVLEYEARFSELSKYAPHIVTDERRKAKKFVMGLRPSLRTRLVAFDHRNLDEALSAACRQEGEMEQYLEEKKASQKRPAALF